jgi:myosin-1
MPFQLFALETMRDKYWHNMAGRIQRAWRNYLRYRNECARRVQRFWKNNKESITYAQIRDHGHDLLAQRKERRRFSLLGYRRFMGDYLDVNGKSALGEDLAEAAGIGSACFDTAMWGGDLIILQEITLSLVVVLSCL